MAFQKALRESEVPQGKMRKARIGKQDFAIIRAGGTFYGIDSVCSHEGGPVGEGSLDRDALVCPWHEGRFDDKTGKAD